MECFFLNQAPLSVERKKSIADFNKFGPKPAAPNAGPQAGRIEWRALRGGQRKSCTLAFARPDRSPPKFISQGTL